MEISFFVKGVVYIGSGGASDDAVFDPLLDVSQCNIDAGLMKKLGTNTVRVLAVDGSQNHDGCMQADASQGIYVWVSLANPAHTISPGSPDWTMDMFKNWTATVKQLGTNQAMN